MHENDVLFAVFGRVDVGLAETSVVYEAIAKVRLVVRKPQVVVRSSYRYGPQFLAFENQPSEGANGGRRQLVPETYFVAKEGRRRLCRPAEVVGHFPAHDHLSGELESLLPLVVGGEEEVRQVAGVLAPMVYRECAARQSFMVCSVSSERNRMASKMLDLPTPFAPAMQV